MTTNENAAAVRIRAFLNSRQGQTDRFAGTDDAPLTLSDLSAVLNQLDAVRHKTIEDAFRWLRDQAPTDLEGATLTVGPGMEMTVYSQWEIVGWLVEQEKLMHRAADAMAGRNAR